MSNFSYLSTRPEYSLFANSAIEAEKVFSTSPAMCAVGCRKALELAVKWVYAADKTITMPYKDNLQSLLHEPSFRFAVDRDVWSVLPSIVKAGNLAVHTGHSVSAADAVLCALSLPCGRDSGGLPIGAQLIGRPLSEETVLRAGHALEGALDFAGHPIA